MPTMQRALAALLFFTILYPAGAAHAQEPELPKDTVAQKQSAAVSLIEFESVMTAAGCKAEAITDPRFVADAKNAIRPLIHGEDANAMLTNKKHVVYAYAALLVLLVVFILFLYQRQRGFASRLQDLEDDLKAAHEDEAK